MNRRLVLYRVGQLLVLETFLLLLPLLVSIIYGEHHCIKAFAMTMLIAAVPGLTLSFVLKPKTRVYFAKEGFALVSLAWVLVSLVGALPYFISGEIPNYVDAVFETVSGITTTGATILTDVEKMSHGLLFWRSFTHWIGGMGVLVLMMAILPSNTGRSMHIRRAEMAGPIIGKIVPKIKDTAKILYIIYLCLTVLETGFLLLGGMPLFDSIVYSLGTAGTGGFGIKADSVESYSPYIQWVITVFMLVFSLNFNLYYMLLLRRFRSFITNHELWVFIGIVFIASAVVGVCIYPIYGNVGDAARHAMFQVASISSTTGYSTADFDRWPQLAKGVLFLLMFIGGCAGSTAGGLKVSRVMLLVKQIQKEIKRMLHPRSVSAVKLEGKAVDDDTLRSVSTYFATYILLNALAFILICADGFDFQTNITAAVSCVNNVGPGFGSIGPAFSYSGYSDFSTIVLTFAMLLGRLEIFPLLLAADPRLWLKRNG